ncbi:MAG TPA: hypothetical protein VES40_21540 [Ilumatobacteraceae bacterium]|nr:hypothetical protein [Ilumatobacteraceae bacterium]
MATLRFTTLAAMTAAALVLASCGGVSEEGAGSLLQPPRPVRVVDSPALAAAEGRLSSDSSLSSMPAFMGFTYEAGPDLPALPTNSTGYQYPPGATVDAATVAGLASALDVEGEPVAGGGADVDGLSWRVGPDDGSAPSLTVGADAQLSVNYSTTWAGATGVGCAVAETPVPVSKAPATTVAGTTDTTCPEVEAPVGVPTADEAEALAADVLEEVGLDSASFSFDTYADDWAASVTAYGQFDGVRSPVAWGFGFGENSELQWMNGTLATPIATGPYPLIGLDEALQRLDEQNMWFGGGPAVMNDMAVTSEAATDVVAEPPVSTPMPTETIPVGSVPVESIPVETIPVEVTVSTLVDVRADLWWAWDDDGSVWLLPAYTFTDTEDRTFTVAAVTDEFLVIADPVLVDPMPLDPSPVEPAPVDPATTAPVDTSDIIGLGVDDATKVLDGRGLTLRVVVDDGVALAVTEDYSSSRVNVEVVDGVVTAVVSIG